MTKSDTNLPTYKKALLQVVAHRNIRTAVDEVLATHNLNTMQWIILGLVNDHPSQFRITDIAQIMQVEGPFVTNLVGPIVKAGYLASTVHERDNRARILTITSQGKSIVKKTEQELAQHLHKLEKGLSKQDIARYFKSLDIFIKNTSPLSDDII